MDRMQEGYFGPTASRDRSLAMENRFNITSLGRINSHKQQFLNLLNNPKERVHHKIRQTVMVEETERGEKKPIERDMEWSKDLQLKQLEDEWRTIPKGGKEELDWVERSIALAAAGFENYKAKSGEPNFSLRENQLYFMTQLVLNKGSYDFGSLETEARGIEMHTGEGKTFCFGLVAPIMATQGEPVLVVEPNYISAKNHAGQMAGFYEDFYHITTGVVTGVPEKEGAIMKTTADQQGVFHNLIVPTGGLQSFRYMNGKLLEEQGRNGRAKTWAQKIVYLDPDSLAFDWLTDHQIGSKVTSGQPDLSKVSMLVAEADDLMLDKARNPFVVSEKSTDAQAWSRAGEMAGFEALYPPDWNAETRQATTKRALFTLWANLYEADRNGYFKQGYGQDYMMLDRRMVGSDRLTFKAFNIASQSLAPIFGFDENAEMAKIDSFVNSWAYGDTLEKAGWDSAVGTLRRLCPFTSGKSEAALYKLFAEGPPKGLMGEKIKTILRKDNLKTIWNEVSDIINGQERIEGEELQKRLGFLAPENRQAMTDLIGWFEGNTHVIDAALEALLGMRTEVDFIGKERPVLLDEYGFPLERRQLHDLSQTFLQLHHAWKKHPETDKPITEKTVMEIEKTEGSKFDISHTISRVLFPSLIQKSKRLRFSSGSLLPSAGSFRDIYSAEVLAVSRHLDIPETAPPAKKTTIRTKCLDGGIAQVEFSTSQRRRLEELKSRAKDIREARRMGLFIVQDIDAANRLKGMIPDAVLATGAQELDKRGALDKATSVGTPGKVIITTWIAHRDVDVKLPPEVLQAGGLDCVVCGNAPTERGLWQALQRSLRGDLPGTRTLLLAPEDFEAIQNQDVVTGQMSILHRPAEKVHKERVREMQSNWNQALIGDNSSKEKLFTQYLSSLRNKEESMKRQLMHSLIRDADLEGWQAQFVSSGGRFSEDSRQYMDAVMEEVKQQLALRGSMPESLLHVPLHKKDTSPELQKILRRLESEFALIAPQDALAKTEALKTGWADFLRFLDVDSSIFLADLDSQKLPPDLQVAAYKSRIDNILQGKIPA